LIRGSDEEKISADFSAYEISGAMLEGWVGKEITISFDAKKTEEGTCFIDSYLRSTVMLSPKSPEFEVSNSWQRFSFTIVVTDAHVRDTESLVVRSNQYVPGNTAGHMVGVKNIKLERGNKPTDWSPAPEDVQTYADHKAQEAEQAAKGYAEQKAAAAEQAAKGYAAAEAELKAAEAQAAAEQAAAGMVSAETQARIDDANAKLAEAKSYAEQSQERLRQRLKFTLNKKLKKPRQQPKP